MTDEEKQTLVAYLTSEMAFMERLNELSGAALIRIRRAYEKLAGEPTERELADIDTVAAQVRALVGQQEQTTTRDSLEENSR